MQCSSYNILKKINLKFRITLLGAVVYCSSFIHLEVLMHSEIIFTESANVSWQVDNPLSSIYGDKQLGFIHWPVTASPLISPLPPYPQDAAIYSCIWLYKMQCLFSELNFILIVFQLIFYLLASFDKHSCCLQLD